MASSLLFQKFDGTRDSWEEYSERLQYFLVANGITDTNRQKAILLTSIGASNFSLLRSLVSADGIATKSFEGLQEVLKVHFSPKPSEVGQRFKFNSCVRKPGESVATFLARLRSLTEHCNFGDSLEPMLRDRVVYGINDRAIQKRLLAESSDKLTFKRAVELAQELADQDMKLLHSSRTDTSDRMVKHEVPTSVLRVTHQRKSRFKSPREPEANKSQQPQLSCFRCGNKGHIATHCRFPKSIVCNACGKAGHIRKVCRSKKGSTSFQQSPRSSASQTVHQVQSESSEANEQYPSEVDNHWFCINAVAKTPPLMVDVCMDDRLVSMEIDTGASVSVISEKVFTELWPGKPSMAKLCGYNNTPLSLCGSCEVKVVYQGQQLCLPLTVVKWEGPSLMGRDWLQSLVVDWRSIHAIATYDPPLQQLLRRYAIVFQEGLGTLKGFKATVNVNSDA